MQTARILIVDDEAIIARAIENSLKQAGYSTLGIALSGEDAILLSRDLRPDLILMDIMMTPELDGIETASQIHQFLDVPVIYVTAYDDPAHLRRAKKTEPYGYLIKPIEEHVLLSTIEVALHKHKVEKKLKQQLLRLTATRTMDRAILSNQALQPTLDIFLQQIISSLNVDAARILLFTNGCQSLENKTVHGIQENAPQGYASVVMEQAQKVFIPNLNDATPAPHLNWFKNEGFLSYYGIPLTSNNAIHGVLEIFNCTEIEADGEWLETLEALIGQVNVGLEHFTLLKKLHSANDELLQSYDATIQGWSRALELRDQETEGHSQRVTTLTLKLAAIMDYPKDKMLHLRRGALLHDIGKMGIPDGTLIKPGPLTSEDWVVMRKHPQYAYDLLKGIPFLQEALEIPYSHHEKWDGSGYPCGLKGEAIPLAARIFAIIDVWDALRSERIYRESWPAEKVLTYIVEQSGSHFDPQVVDAFLKLYSAEGF